MSNTKRLGNPLSTGAGVCHFETHIQSCLVSLMLNPRQTCE